MQPLSAILKNTSPSATQAEAKRNTLQHGLTSADGLTNTRPIVQHHRAVTLETDDLEKMILDLLKRLPSLRINSKTIGKYSETEYLGEVRNVTITHSDEADIEKLKQSLLEFLRPSGEEFVLLQLAKLRSRTAMREKGLADTEMRLACYAKALCGYPTHAVEFSCEREKNTGWFPDMEIKLTSVCDARISLAKSLLRQIEEKKYEPQNQQIENKSADYRNIPRQQWQAQHFLQKIQDCVAIADIHRQDCRVTDELGMLIAAQRFIADARKFPDTNTEMGLIYQIATEVWGRVVILEKRLCDDAEQDSIKTAGG